MDSTALIFRLGKHLSRSFEHIGDLYKAQTTIPAAFEAVTSARVGTMEQTVRRICRRKVKEQRILKRIADDLDALFEEAEKDPNQAAPCGLWDETGTVSGGKNYAGDKLW